MKSRYVFAGIVTIALVLVTIGLVQVVSADYRTNTTKTWVGVDGNWETAANWNPSGVPDVGDDVTINGGSVTISSAQSVTSLTGAGDLAISGLFTWSGGTMSGTGTTTANGGISITTGATKQLWSRTLNNSNNGTCTYDGSNFGLYLSSFNNQAGATFNFPTDGTIGSIVGGTFNNAGTFNRTTTSGMATIQVAFNNSGTVNVQTGTLSLQGTGTHTGTFTVADSTTLSISGGGQLTGVNISGGGKTTFGGANCTINGSTLGNTAISSYNVAFSGADSTATSLELTGGTVDTHGQARGTS